MEKERNVSREIEEYRYEQAKNNDLDALLLVHINDMGVLLENHDGSLTKNRTTAALARAKTRHVIHPPSSHDQQPLDLSGALLSRIDMSVTNDIVSTRNVSFVGVHMNEAWFVGHVLSHSY